MDDGAGRAGAAAGGRPDGATVRAGGDRVGGARPCWAARRICGVRAGRRVFRLGLPAVASDGRRGDDTVGSVPEVPGFYDPVALPPAASSLSVRGVSVGGVSVGGV